MDIVTDYDGYDSHGGALDIETTSRDRVNCIANIHSDKKFFRVVIPKVDGEI